MSTALSEYRAFLGRVLPSDYDERYSEYRWDVELRTRFQAQSFDEGWVVPEWPRDLGGSELGLTDALEVRIEGATRRVPRQMNVQAAGVVAPALRNFGTPEQQEAYLRPTLRGEAWWALGMSEPGAGSDLASLRTTAVLRGETFVINGQKVWTTQADEARWCTLYVRTDTAAPKHRGISCLILPMDTPGITVRPIETAGPSIESFCEVFLDNVELPKTALLGELNEGWKVAMSALEHERDMIWINNWLEMQRALAPALCSMAKEHVQRETLGRLLADQEAIRLMGIRSVAARASGLESSLPALMKLFGSEAVQKAAAFSLETGASHGVAPLAEFDEYLESLAATIYGGTSEVQRNIIAERALGLPKGN